MSGDGVIEDWPPAPPDTELVDATKFTSDLCHCLARIQSEFHGLVQRLNMNSRNHGHVRARSRRPNPLDPQMATAMQDMSRRVQEAIAEFKVLAEQANRITAVVDVKDLLLEVGVSVVEAGGVVEAKASVIGFRRDELAGNIDWEEGPNG